MAKPYCECHVTVAMPQDKERARAFEALAAEHDWKTPAVDQEPS